jgi:uncharacterized membrane protein
VAVFFTQCPSHSRPSRRGRPLVPAARAPGPGAERNAARLGACQRHPAVLELEQQRTQNVQIRIADWITAFAGLVNFVYLHVVLFAVWMLFIERSPWPTLTLIVPREAIFLSTFVMIGQNLQASFQQAKADHDFTEQELNSRPIRS